MSQTERKVYLDAVPPQEALQRLLAACDGVGWGRRVEAVPTENALGRVTAAPVLARISSPHFHASAMDGVAVRAVDTFGASETTPVSLQFGPQALWVDTGDPLPSGMDAVVMVENVNLSEGGHAAGQRCEIIAAVAPWQHVRPIGEDVVATEMVVPEAHVLRPADIGALLAAGVLTVPVAKKPVVTFIPTGNELVQPTAAPQSGELIEFNSRVVLGLVGGWGGEPRRHPIVRDNFAAIKAAVEAAVDSSDAVIINAGSSAGSEDFSVHVLGELGEVLAHGVAIRPGKPVMFALVKGKPVLGLPGYPVSTYITADLFLRPLIYRSLGMSEPVRPTVTASLARRLTKPMGTVDYVRVKLGRVGERLVATPISRGAGVITSMVRADGMLIIPAELEGVAEGEAVNVELMRPLAEIQDTVVATGSHEITLDLIASFLRRRRDRWGFASAHVGSQGGLTALKRGEAHLAGVHLLDEATGEYNISYVQRYFGGPAVLVLLARRDQGFLVARGNPRGIHDFKDLARPDVTFVNRQRGAGTRLLLDFHLRQAGISPASVQGYRREEFTHLAVAAAVQSGAADAGLGILAAAQALDLDFIPITREEYELCIPEQHLTHGGVQAVLALLQDPEFRREVEALGGYDTAEAGRVRKVPLT